MTPESIQLALPEILVLTMICLVLVVDVHSRDPEHRAAYWLTQLTLLAALSADTLMGPKGVATAFHGMFVRDPLAVVLKSFVLAMVIFGLIYGRDYLRLRRLLSGEFFVLALMAVLGIMVLVSAGSLLTIYLGLELLSLSLYALVAMHRDSPAASEAAMKYFVLGALASGMLLYGMSMLYGVTGTLDLVDMANAATAAGSDRLLMVFALVFIVVGVAFKLGLVPFHMWVPDVYEGAPTAVTLLIATASKVAAFAMAMRLLADGLQHLSGDWHRMLIALAVASMIIGNVVAIAQSNIKRMLAYSTINHMGFLLLGLLAATPSGYAGAMFYAIVYALMSLGAFGVIILIGDAGRESDRLDDFKGFTRRSPWFAFVMLIMMFSLAGVPPFAGFWAKWFVLKEVINAGHVWLAAVAVLFSIIGAYYYLRVVKLMYFDPPASGAALAVSADTRLALSVNGLAILLLGIMPGLLMAVCISAVR
ncbi:MAG: NADH-quinone oxidoreductase subunit NuoN [Chromatiales bacterium]